MLTGEHGNRNKECTGIIPQRLADTGAQLIGTIHDEIIFEVPDRLANDAAAVQREAMIQTGKAYLGKVPVEVEVAVADKWAEKWG